VNDSLEWEVERVLDPMRRYRQLHYLIQLMGQSQIGPGWELLEHLENAGELIYMFH
jgi:hypothetical protein